MDCFCLKRRHDKRREQKKFRPLSPHVSPTHSQPSTLGHNMADGRLPKVNSTGLWFGSAGMYASSPSPAYYYGRPTSSNNHRIDPLTHIPRAISETRIPHSRSLAMEQRPPRRAVSLQRVPTSGQRIYHSQPLAPVYEVPPVRGMEIYDVYQFAGPSGGSRSKLIETRHTPQYYSENREFRMNSQLERSKSDAQERRAARPGSNNSKPSRSTSQDKHRHEPSSRENSQYRVYKSTESVVKSGGVQRSPSGAHDNRAFSSDMGVHKISSRPVSSTASVVSNNYLPNGTAGMVSATVSHSHTDISPSATDSMKLLAKNKTDDQKTQPPLTSLMTEKHLNVNDHAKNLDHHRYEYQGDIYTMPKKVGYIKDEESDNPLLDRMNDMVIEKTTHGSTPSGSPYVIISSSQTTDVTNGGGYEEITKVTKVTKVIESYETVPVEDTVQAGSGTNGDTGNFVLPELADLEKSAQKVAAETKSSNLLTADDAIAGVTSAVVRDVTPSPEAPRKKVSPRMSVDHDGAEVGKQITAHAFQFLDTYLSDEEGGDSHVDSPPLSPRALPVEVAH